MCAPKFKIKWGVAYHQNTLKVSTWRFGFFFIHNKQLLPIIWIYEWYAYWIKKETFFSQVLKLMIQTMIEKTASLQKKLFVGTWKRYPYRLTIKPSTTPNISQTERRESETCPAERTHKTKKNEVLPHLASAIYQDQRGSSKSCRASFPRTLPHSIKQSRHQACF